LINAMTVLDTFRRHYRQRDLAARAWKAAGGKVVGYLCDNVPEELIIAAGFLPYRLSGDPLAGTDAIERYVQPFAPPFSARNRGVGFVDAMLEMLLDGRFDFLDYLVIPHTRKTIQAMYRELDQARAAHPDLVLPELHYLDRAYTPFYASEVFNREHLLELRSQLERWSGQPLTVTALAEAIELTNTSRYLLQRLATLRGADPPQVSGVDALQVIATSFFMPKAEHNQLLRNLLEVPPHSALRGKARLFVGGSPLDNLQLYELVESCGGVVIAEDHCWGNRCGEAPADTSLPPFEALADRYHRQPACSIEFPMARVVDRCVARACTASVDGALFFVMQDDGVHVWDTPDEIAALERNGIPSLHLTRQPYHFHDPEPLRQQLGQFIGTLRS
jgi:benzoyl-CoA reductase/2-hydroxyglutaryl-CoA dehydratase subunit BcrC/BadD/HgdB